MEYWARGFVYIDLDPSPAWALGRRTLCPPPRASTDLEPPLVLRGGRVGPVVRGAPSVEPVRHHEHFAGRRGAGQQEAGAQEGEG